MNSKPGSLTDDAKRTGYEVAEHGCNADTDGPISHQHAEGQGLEAVVGDLCRQLHHDECRNALRNTAEQLFREVEVLVSDHVEDGQGLNSQSYGDHVNLWVQLS